MRLRTTVPYMKNSMKVAEKFISINGEGTRAGELAVFIRFKGCNLHCGYCDTQWANQADCAYEEMDPEDIYAYIKSAGIRNVTLTGGEPLLQREMDKLLDLLISDPELRVEVETNGAVSILPFCGTHRPFFTMDYKLPGSGCEAGMNIKNFEMLNQDDTVKFVAGSKEDLVRAKQIMERYDLLNRCHVYFSPVFGSIEPREIVSFMIENCLNQVRLQIQMHKVIWEPDRRGV